MRNTFLILGTLLVALSSPFGLGQEQKVCAIADTEKHNLKTIHTDWKCSEAAAIAAITKQLVDNAEKERKDKCSERVCNTVTPCNCSVAVQKFHKIKEKIGIEIAADKTCKDGVAYRAYLEPDKDDTYESECRCIPKGRDSD